MNVDHGEKMRMLVELCRELTALNLSAMMSDARPALSVRTDVTSPLWISVSPCGRFYEGHSDFGDRLTATDPHDTARRIADYLRSGTAPHL